MNKGVVSVEVRAVVPTNAGFAVFLGNSDKSFVIYVDPAVGTAIAAELRGLSRERPQTHDLVHTLLEALGAQVTRVVVNDFKDGVFFARLILTVENEVTDRKIIELDARPSDSLAIALRQKSPLFVAESVWEEMEDMTDVLVKMEDRGFNFGFEDL
ncbi:MAG: bifunctional nuclease family protein [Verrucomicrobiota bacterium]